MQADLNASPSRPPHTAGAVPWPARQSLLSRREAGLLGVGLAGLLLAWLAPAVAQFDHYHAFADQRAWGLLPHALDVLSNLPFALLGLWGGWLCWRARASGLPVAQWRMALLFFAGLVVTAACSSYYHWAPDDARLLVDRGGMVLAFAGLLGLAACRQVSARAGQALAAAVLVLGWASVAYWQATGNVLPWGVLQGGGMVLLLAMAGLPAAQPGLQVRWGVLLAVYAAAKALELLDAPVYAWSAHLLSGHSLKHVVAACAALPVMAALRGFAMGRA